MKTKAKRRPRAAAVAVAVALVAAALLCAAGGCEYQLYVSNGISAVDNGAIDTGSGGDIESKYVDPGIRLYNMPGDIDSMEEGTYDTPETFGRSLADDSDETTREKYILKGPVISTSKLDSGGFTDVMFVYYDEPLTTDFTLRARVQITAKAGDSTSKGYLFGAFTGTPKFDAETGELDRVEFTVSDKGAGILYRTKDNNLNVPSLRYYYHSGSGWSVGPSSADPRPEYFMNEAQPEWRQERILEVVRLDQQRTASDESERNIAFIFRVYDSKSLDLLSERFLDKSSVGEMLQVGSPVYTGIALLGCSVEYSQITLWNKAYIDPEDMSVRSESDVVFKTPNTHPAYVGVDSVTINLYPSFPLEAYPGVPSTSRTRSKLPLAAITGTPLALTPVFEPNYADNPYFDWEIVGPYTTLPNTGFTLTPIDGDQSTGWKEATITITQDGGNVTIMATSRDSGKADWSLQIQVN
jgi:hypothetical protein